MARWSRGRLRTAPLYSLEGDRALGHLSPEERYGQAWLEQDGELYGGHEAAWRSVYLLPGGALLKPLRLLPGFQPLSRAAYCWVADRWGPGRNRKRAARRAEEQTVSRR